MDVWLEQFGELEESVAPAETSVRDETREPGAFEEPFFIREQKNNVLQFW